MHSKSLFAMLSGLALVSAQTQPAGPPNQTIENTPVYDGVVIPGVTGEKGNAPITTNNPVGVTYQATLPKVNFDGATDVQGYISGTSNSNGTGVVFNINFYNFPSPSLGPFIYHIHELPVSPDGNCTLTGPHLDPTIRLEQPPCDATQPESCQVGDLAGKHGNITGIGAFQTQYVDLYATTVAGVDSFFGNRSIVVHSSNTTRLTCANFTLVANITTNSTSPSSPTVTPFTGAAATQFMSTAAVLGGLMAFALL